LVVYSLSRLARSTKDALLISEQLVNFPRHDQVGNSICQQWGGLFVVDQIRRLAPARVVFGTDCPEVGSASHPHQEQGTLVSHHHQPYFGQASPTDGPSHMKKKIPAPTQAEVAEALPKDQTVQLRLSPTEKEAIKEAASACGRTVSEYLLACHQLVARKLK
jgi:Mobilization protein NikA